MAKKKNSQFLPGLLEDIMSLLTPRKNKKLHLNCLMMERIR